MIKTIDIRGRKIKVVVSCKASDGDDYIVFLVNKNGTVTTDAHNDRYNYPVSDETVSLRTHIHASSDVVKKIDDAIKEAGGKVHMESSGAIMSSLNQFLIKADLIELDDGDKTLGDDGYGPNNEYSYSQFNYDTQWLRLLSWRDEIGCWLSPDSYKRWSDRE